MLHAAAMFLGLCVVWLLATQRFETIDDVGVAVIVALVCTAIGMRAAGVSAAFARAPRAIYTVFARLGSVLTGAGATVRAAVAADVTLKPALVRVRTRGQGAERAAFADMLSATPGMAVVETDADGLLVHVMDEDSIDAADLGRLERITGAQESAR